MSLKKWISEKIHNFLHVKDNSNGRGEVDRSGEVTIRSNSAAEKLDSSKLELLHNNWVSLFQMSCPNDKINCYVYSHETRCDGKIVAFVPYRYINNNQDLQVLLRNEATPCWNYIEQVPSSFTGGVEEGETPLQTVLHELREEAGYIVDKDKIINLGQVFGTKSSDTIYFLFGVNLTDVEQEKELISESELEKTSFNRWCYFNTISDLVPDSMFNCICFRLQNYLTGGGN